MVENGVKEGWVDVKNIPTHVCTWGWEKWIEDKTEDMESRKMNSNGPVILLLTGNPGVIKYYYSFLDTLYKNLKVPICVLSHAGHEFPPENSKNAKLSAEADYNVTFQVSHKSEFIKKYIPIDKDVYIIAHSFGAKVVTELLKEDYFQKQIKKCYLVFPTLERIADTPNGKFIQFIIKYFFSIVVFLTFIFSMFPYSLRWWLIKIYFFLNGKFNFPSNCIDATIDLVRPAVITNVFNLASDEMDKIRELDKEVIEKCVKKFRVYFGANDGWAPVEYHKNLMQQIPNIDSRILNSKYEHSFVLDPREDFAMELSDYIKPELI